MRNSETRSQYRRLESAIASYLADEGIPAERKGYAYLACAIRFAYEDRELTGALSKELYPAVAERFAVSPGAVERSIRTAIACARGKKEKEIADACRKTNSSFIFEAAERVKMMLDK